MVTGVALTLTVWYGVCVTTATHWWLALHVWFAGQPPQSRVLPHPSSIVPHDVPQLAAWHADTQWFAEQVVPRGHEPQLSVPPHPSLMLPQLLVGQFLLGVHPPCAKRSATRLMSG